MVTPPLVRKPAEQKLTMSYEAFLEWADEDTHAEWIDGEVIVFMPAKYNHQVVVGFLYELLALFTRLFNMGQIHIAPLGMRLAHSSREPDILFILNENLHRLSNEGLVGPADLVIEVVSDDSVRRDRDNKFREYAQAGIPEYWIIDPRPEKNRSDFYHLNEKGNYTLFATEDDEWVSSKALVEFRLKPARIWQAAELNPLTCALQIEGVAGALQEQLNGAK
jgi:Uma2 family endonuclease